MNCYAESYSMGEMGSNQHIKKPLKVSFPTITKEKREENRYTFEPQAPAQGKGRLQRLEAQVPCNGLKGDPKQWD